MFIRNFFYLSLIAMFLSIAFYFMIYIPQVEKDETEIRSQCSKRAGEKMGELKIDTISDMIKLRNVYYKDCLNDNGME